MSLNPLVSIIIPVYNREKLILETLKSVNKQSYQNWGCIIVDDQSTDDSYNIISNYIHDKPRFKLFVRPSYFSKGGCGARNYGFEISNGEYVNWFDSDDIMATDFLSEKVKIFIQNSDVDVVISKTAFFTNTINQITGYEKRTFSSNNLLEDFASHKTSWYICDPLWKKKFLLGKDLFNSRLLKGQDRDFHTRMLIHKPKVLFSDSILSYYRQNITSISNNFSVEVNKSLNDSLIERLELLKNEKVSFSTILFMLKLISKNYKYIYKENGASETIVNLYLNNFNLSFTFLLWFCKINLAIVSFRLFGKGEKFLKG
jgi:glycosyltransferase involved in cell wall biosynthesis